MVGWTTSESNSSLACSHKWMVCISVRTLLEVDCCRTILHSSRTTYRPIVRGRLLNFCDLRFQTLFDQNKKQVVNDCGTRPHHCRQTPTVASSLYITVVRQTFRLRNAFSVQIYERTSSTWFPGPTQVSRPKGISIGSGVFAGLTRVPNTQRHTDRPRYVLMCSSRLHLCEACDVTSR